ncbi:MAG: hypothetical protein H7256_03245 [Bdellovibrio sp.]|nr:hypothetical protein [Bdellovibrio sp.]
MNKFMNLMILVVAAFAFSSCSKIDSVMDKAETIPGKMDSLNTNMDELKRLTIVGEMKKELEDTKNYKVLAPVPFDLNAAAKKAAENFTIDEVVPWIYNLLQKINEAKFEDNFGRAINPNDPQAVEFEQNKLGTMSAISAVCGFLPESMINQMLVAIDNGDEDAATMVSMFAMRAYFINNVLMKEKYAPSKLTSIGAVEKAIFYNKQVENLLRLPYADKINVTVNGFELNTDFNAGMSYGLDFNAAKVNWSAISNGMESYLKVNQYSTDPNQVKNQLARQTAALAEIQQGQAAWANVKP